MVLKFLDHHEDLASTFVDRDDSLSSRSFCW